MSELTSTETEERVARAARHQTNDDEDEFQPIPLKRLDSGAHQHNIQGGEEESAEGAEAAQAIHRAILEDLDRDTSVSARTLTKAEGKKEETLKRMLRGIRIDEEKEFTDESASNLNSTISISKLFQRINPVGKASREGFSKVMHRIGDAIHKKEESDPGKDLQETSSLSERKKIGERNFQARKPKTDSINPSN